MKAINHPGAQRSIRRAVRAVRIARRIKRIGHDNRNQNPRRQNWLVRLSSNWLVGASNRLYVYTCN